MIAAFTTAVTLSIFIMGLATVILSIVVASYFSKHRTRVVSHDGRRLSKALRWQLLGEAVIGWGTLVFAMAAHFGWLPAWSLYTQSGLRFAMFAATSITTLHLFLVVRNISNRND